METIKLIEGNYTSSEAAEILLSVIDDKIRFHEIKRFGLKERFGVDSEESIQRLKELKEDRNKVINMMEESEGESIEFSISSSINITVNTLA